MATGNDYVIQVKGNQKNLLNAIKDHILENDPDDIYETREKNRGRRENREIQIYNKVAGQIFDDWTGLNTLISVRNWGFREKKPYEEYHYYISSRSDSNAKIFAEGIRAHWYIENKLHWVKDVILGEDKSMVKGNCLARNLSLLRSLVINIYRLNKEPSLKKGIEKFTNRVSQCLVLMNIEKNYI